jgi:hypothetical protein
MTPNEFTRRGWLLQLGGAAALHGISATDLGAAERPPLPPGLYEPSLQHLAHSLKANIQPAAEPVSPRHFNPEDFSLVRTIIAIMLGEEPSAPTVLDIAVWIDMIVGRAQQVSSAARSLSPAHRRLAVDYYGEDVVSELESEDAEAICRNGLSALRQAGFEARDDKAQLSHLLNLENANDPFIAWMKHRTLDGFYTSRSGLEELDYKGNAFYAHSPGCDHENGSQ